MSPVNRLALIPRSCFITLFFVQISMYSYEKPGSGPITKSSVSMTKILITGMNIFPYEHFSLGDWDETVLTKVAEMAYFFLHVFPLQR